MSTNLFEAVNPRYLLSISDEPKQLLQPISGYAREPLVPLEQACEPLLSIVPQLPAQIWVAMENSKNPADDLTQDESASIHLYTMEWQVDDSELRGSLYYHLNRTLKQIDRNKLRPWFRYLKLFLTALAKLPPVSRQTVWRGVHKDYSGDYPPGSKATWWAFSSCTTSLKVLESDLYLGNTGTRTLFSIETLNGRIIRAHSHFTAEDEVLLLPGTYFEVLSQLNPAPDLHIVHLRQTRPPHELLEPPFDGAQLLPLPELTSSDARKTSELLKITETRPWYKKRRILIGLGIIAMLIILAVVLGSVLGSRTGNKNHQLYWVYGPQVNFNPQPLSSGGWTQCYKDNYALLLNGQLLTNVLNTCNKANLLMGCSPVNASNYTVAAMGQRSDVLYDCNDDPNCSHQANGVAWYFSSNYSWGFAKSGDTIVRAYCDNLTIDDGYRLCWHTILGFDGYRCGATRFYAIPYISPAWLRIIWHAD